MERMYLEELFEILKYRDHRSIRRWCLNNQVQILFDVGSKWRFVLKEELEKALNRIQQETEKQVSGRKRVNHRKYTPQGEIEKAFLSTLQT